MRRAGRNRQKTQNPLQGPFLSPYRPCPPEGERGRSGNNGFCLVRHEDFKRPGPSQDGRGLGYVVPVRLAVTGRAGGSHPRNDSLFTCQSSRRGLPAAARGADPFEPARPNADKKRRRSPWPSPVAQNHSRTCSGERVKYNFLIFENFFSAWVSACPKRLEDLEKVTPRCSPDVPYRGNPDCCPLARAEETPVDNMEYRRLPQNCQEQRWEDHFGDVTLFFALTNRPAFSFRRLLRGASV
jgi:hypothetical protein